MIEVKSDEEAKRLFERSFVLHENGNTKDAYDIRIALENYAPTEERFIIASAQSLQSLDKLEEAESKFRRAVFLNPSSELASLQLFHYLWSLDKNDQAFDEIRRFQSLAHSDDYVAIVNEINKKL
jgi:tetratricopeptide (TPR) repeat protein